MQDWSIWAIGMRLVSEAWKFAVITLPIVLNKILGRYFFLRPYASLGAIRIDVDDDDDHDDDHSDDDDDGDGDFLWNVGENLKHWYV